MGSGNWFKIIICLKKTKEDKSKESEGSSASEKSNGSKSGHHSHKPPFEDVAAIRIQSAFRGYKARKALRYLKGVKRLHVPTEDDAICNQTTTTLNYLKSWSKIQAQIRARRLCMVTEERIKQKKHENQLKLEAKLHELEVEWCGGTETMEEILARIYQREEAAVKRERAMAYAFSHQWRANSSHDFGKAYYDYGKGNWGWSWKERWIAVRPWESRVGIHYLSPNKDPIHHTHKTGKGPFISVKPIPKGGVHADLEKAKISAPEKAATLETNAEVASLSLLEVTEANNKQ